jgi:hypothetical protein
MNRIVPLSLIGSAVALFLAAGTSQAAVLGVTSPAPAATHASLLSEARWWRRHHCWWRHHRRYCR